LELASHIGKQKKKRKRLERKKRRPQEALSRGGEKGLDAPVGDANTDSVERKGKAEFLQKMERDPPWN